MYVELFMWDTMGRGRISKTDMLARVYKLKTELFDGKHSHKNGDWHDGRHSALNEMLDMLNEYSQWIQIKRESSINSYVNGSNN